MQAEGEGKHATSGEGRFQTMTESTSQKKSDVGVISDADDEAKGERQSITPPAADPHAPEGGVMAAEHKAGEDNSNIKLEPTSEESVPSAVVVESDEAGGAAESTEKASQGEGGNMSCKTEPHVAAALVHKRKREESTSDEGICTCVYSHELLKFHDHRYFDWTHMGMSHAVTINGLVSNALWDVE